MAMDQLGLYNEALTIIGQRELATLTEDRAPRHRLDSVYGREAVEYCLELVKPNFASKVATLSTPSSISTFDYSHAKPADYVTLMEVESGGTKVGAVYSDAKLDQLVHRHIVEGDNISGEMKAAGFAFKFSGSRI